MYCRSSNFLENKSLDSQISSKVSYWARNGGDIWVLLCSQRAGDTKNFFEKFIVFGVLARAVENAKNYQLCEKIFRVPPRCEHSNTQMSPPPPRCVPSKTQFWQISEFLTFFGRFGLFYMLLGKKHCCSSGCHFVISPGEPHQ